MVLRIIRVLVRQLYKFVDMTRVVVTLALLGHQTLHSQNKFFFSLVAQCTNAIVIALVNFRV